jgi:hypothetical protein
VGVCDCLSAAEIVVESFIFVLVFVMKRSAVTAVFDGSVNSFFGVVEEHLCSVLVCPVGLYFVDDRSVEDIII